MNTAAGEEGSLPDLRTLVETKDWSSTPLGPKDQWSEALRTTVETCLGSRFPVIIFWGPDLVQVYNDAYAPIIDAKHPEALGQTAEACFPEIWDVIGPMLNGVLQRGEATWSDNLLLMLERKGFAEECYFTFSYSPAGGAPVEGVFCAVIETTDHVIGERRFNALRDLATSLAGTHHVADVLGTAVEVLSRHPSDLPAGVLRVEGPDGSAESRWWSAEDSDADRDALTEVAEEATRTGSRVVRGRGPGEREYRPGAPAVAAYPIDRPGSPLAPTVLAVDLNRHLLLDDGYRDFIGLVASAIGAAISGAESYEAAEQRAAALEELDQAKTSFLSNVSHEFRTPLTLLLGPLREYAGDGRLPDEVRRGMAMAERNARRLLRLVNSLLDFARLEAGRATAGYQATDLAQLTADVAAVFRSAAESAGLELVIDCPPLQEPVYVDPDMWEQIVTNICSNAVKFTRSGSVTVSLRLVDGQARLDVADTGIGIAPDELPYVFDRFRRTAAAGAHTAEGTGLGLAIVRELVVLHGGTIEVRSQPDQGSIFTVTVPVGAAHLAPAQIAPTAGRSSRPEDAAASLEGPPPVPILPAPPAGGPGTVYVIDDNADMRAYLSELLGRHWTTVAFADAAQALAAIDQRPPDLVISDVMMPGADGFQLLARLRGRPATAQLPVMLLSARAGEEAVVEGLEAGADDYMIKPFTSRTLLARVRSHLELAALRRDSTERAIRHNAQLAFLATAAGDILNAETLDEIAAVVEQAARHVTGAVGCELQWGPASPAEGEPAPPGGVVLVVPLVSVSGGTIASLRLTHNAGTVFGPEDRTVVTELAGIAARRIERVREYQRQHQLSDTLQRSLLPKSLPSVGGVDLVARYFPATEAAAVGGDWYDALQLPDGRLMIVVGDVIGHDLDAAISMGQLRHLLRAHALDSPDPAVLCATVNRLLPVLGAGEMATAAVAYFDVDSGHVTMTNAGHPPPVVVGRDGATRLLEIEPCPPLGALDTTEYHTVDTILGPGETLVLYTDGLVERRDEAIQTSLSRFADRCAVLNGPVLGACLDSLLRETLPTGLATDDIAVLTVRRQPLQEPYAPAPAAAPSMA